MTAFGPEDKAVHEANVPIAFATSGQDPASKRERRRLRSRARQIAGTPPFPNFGTVELAASALAYNARVSYLIGLPAIATFKILDAQWLDEIRRAELRDALIERIGSHVDISVRMAAGPSDDPDEPFGINPTDMVVVTVTPTE